MGKNDSIDYDNLTYGDILSTIKKLGINMCNDKKLLKHQLKNKEKLNMKWVIYVNNMVYPLLLLPDKRVKNMIKFTKIITIKNTKPTWLNLMIFMLKRKMFQIGRAHV